MTFQALPARPGRFNLYLVQNSDFRRRLKNIKDQDGNVIDLSAMTITSKIYDKLETGATTIYTPTATAVAPAATSGMIDLFLDNALLTWASISSHLPINYDEYQLKDWPIGFHDLLLQESGGDDYFYFQGQAFWRTTRN